MNPYTGELTRQQLCAALSISESTVRRLELLGLPFTPVGMRAKRYDLQEAKAWLREYADLIAPQARRPEVSRLSAMGRDFQSRASGVRLRVMPSPK